MKNWKEVIKNMEDGKSIAESLKDVQRAVELKPRPKVRYVCAAQRKIVRRG